MPKIAKIEKYEAKDGFRWRFRAPNGRIMADSGEAYSSKPALEKAIKQFLVYINGGYGTGLVIEWISSPNEEFPLQNGVTYRTTVTAAAKDAAFRKKVEGHVFELLQNQLAPGEGFNLNWKLIDDCGTDSLDFVKIILAMEDEFSIEIQDEDAERFVTGQDIVEYIVSRV